MQPFGLYVYKSVDLHCSSLKTALAACKAGEKGVF